MGRAWGVLVALAAGATGCQELYELAEAADGSRADRALAYDDAFAHLRRDPTRAPVTDLGAVMGLIDREVAGDRPLDDPDQARLLRRVAPARQRIDEQGYARVDLRQLFPAAGAARSGACGWDFDPGRLRDGHHLIPGAEKIPVRDQGARGTCAAFTGVGAVEYATLRSRPALATIDLSEQRFYYNSKPECRTPGACDAPYGEGSWYGAGFDHSLASARPDIPLEADCPYDASPGDNDTQVPQADSCEEGAVKLEQVDTWCGIDELIEVLNQGYAVPWASPLSSNWEMNDGLITKRDFTAEGSTVHAGGHAYLIVGYRVLPEMPEEGGVCFIVKNSWGIGWGAAGYGCMTLEWMKAVQYREGGWAFIQQPHPVVKAVAVRGDLDGGEPAPDEDDAAPVPDDDDAAPGPDEDDEAPGPDDDDAAPEPAPEEYASARLLGPDEALYEVLAAERGGALFLRAERDAEALRLAFDGDALVHDGDVVGRRDGADLTVCTGEWAALCALRLRPEDGRLHVQFRDPDLRAVKPWEVAPARGAWVGFGAGYEIFQPSNPDELAFVLRPATYVRVAGSAPMRLSLRPGDALGRFDLRLQGLTVGRVDFFDLAGVSLCDGDFSRVCRLLGGERPTVVPRNERKRAGG